MCARCCCEYGCGGLPYVGFCDLNVFGVLRNGATKLGRKEQNENSIESGEEFLP